MKLVKVSLMHPSAAVSAPMAQAGLIQRLSRWLDAQEAQRRNERRPTLTNGWSGIGLPADTGRRKH